MYRSTNIKYKLAMFAISVITAILIVSCDRDVKHALQMSGENRKELESVLQHFKDDPDDLKYRAAKYLIANAPYHYSYGGKVMNDYDAAYIDMAKQAKQNREPYFEESTKRLLWLKPDIDVDLTKMKASYLIKAINDACDVWKSVTWNKDYDEDLFFDYVLPYRILNEGLSDWRDVIETTFPTLLEDAIVSKRGIQLESEEAILKNGSVFYGEGASNGKAAILCSPNSSIVYSYKATYKEDKLLFLRYTSVSDSPKVIVKLDDITVDTLLLSPTNALTTFTTSRTGVRLNLKRGDNRISICSVGDSIGLDYVQLNSVEPIDRSAQIDFTSDYCLISNKQSNRFLTINTHNDSLPCVARLEQYNENLQLQKLRIDYKGYGCWGIFVHEKDSDLCLETEYCSVKPGSPVGIYHSLNGSNQKWAFIHIGEGYYKIMNKDSGLFLEAKHVGRIDTLCQNPYNGADSQIWKIEKESKRSDVNNQFTIGSSISEAYKVFDVTNQYEWVGYSSLIPPKAASLLCGKTGNCRDEANFTVYLCRKLGIPAAVDFTPHWGNRSLGHSWSVLIKPDGKGTPFYMGCAPCDTVHYYHSYKKPKILRHRFRFNREIANDLKQEKEVPELFKYADFIDVTDEYYSTVDVIRDVPTKFSDKHVAYICVFDNRNWVPVYYGNIKNGKVKFPSMGRGIVYVSAFFDEGQIKPFGMPFLVSSEGKVIDIKCNEKKLQTMHLKRKYPFMGKEDFFNLRMSGGKFQGANNGDFSDASTFYQFEGATNGNWYDIPITDTHTYKYLRYIGPATSHCNINELEFYDADGKQIEGKIIGTEGEGWAPKENAFDGNILTGFSAISPDGNWVGLKLSVPKQVSRLRFIPRNDGNCIEIGDEYELRYWKDDKWKVLGRKVADSNILTFSNMPTGGLYVLSDLTKGHEERIFTYENGEQIWW